MNLCGLKQQWMNKGMSKGLLSQGLGVVSIAFHNLVIIVVVVAVVAVDCCCSSTGSLSKNLVSNSIAALCKCEEECVATSS